MSSNEFIPTNLSYWIHFLFFWSFLENNQTTFHPLIPIWTQNMSPISMLLYLLLAFIIQMKKASIPQQTHKCASLEKINVLSEIYYHNLSYWKRHENVQLFLSFLLSFFFLMLGWFLAPLCWDCLYLYFVMELIVVLFVIWIEIDKLQGLPDGLIVGHLSFRFMYKKIRTPAIFHRVW